MASFGGIQPKVLGNSPMVPSFPRTSGAYADPNGAVDIPAGWGQRTWWDYRASRGTVRGEVVGIGDSTMFGSQGLYSFLQRLRDRAVTFGMADGGKGMFAGGESLGITYDAPEISGFVSSNFVGSPDSYDNTDGQYWYDTGATAGHQTVLQFRQPTARLWFSARADAGDFTYSVDGGAAVTVQAFLPAGGPVSRFVYLSGLTPNTTHTVTITNLATSTNGGTGSACYVALAPMNTTGLVWQKYATSGDTINSRFYGQIAASPYTQSQNDRGRFQSAFGRAKTIVNAPTYTGSTVDTTQPAGGTINPALAMSNLGFNDLTHASDGVDDTGMWTEYVKRFAGVCADAGCDGVILAGQLPYNANWPTYGAARYNILRAQAAAQGLAFVDTFYPVAGPSLSYSGGTGNPHLSKAQYQAQGDFIWDRLLGLT